MQSICMTAPFDLGRLVGFSLLSSNSNPVYSRLIISKLLKKVGEELDSCLFV